MQRRGKFVLVMALTSLSSAVPGANDGVEDFDTTFVRMQNDPEFRYRRAHPGLVVVEEVSWIDSAKEEAVRVIPCGIRELEAAGWSVLPGAKRLAQTGTTYSPPDRVGVDRAAVALGSANGFVDAMYRFKLLDRKWYLVRMEVYSRLEPDDALPPHPCPTVRAPVP